MSTGAFSIDQLMELAGLSVSQAGRLHTYIRRPSLATNLDGRYFGTRLIDGAISVSFSTPKPGSTGPRGMRPREQR